MESHGAIAADKDMDAAFLKAQYVEEIAEMYYITLPPETGQNHMPCRWRNCRSGLIQKKSFFRRI